MQNMQTRQHHKINKKPLYGFGVFLLLGYLVVMSIINQQVKEAVIESKLSVLEQHIIYQSALRQYIATQIKPVFYALQQQGTLSEEFFDPHVLSGTFISRHVYNFFDEKLAEQALTSWQYHLAAKTPRNPINQATPEELKLLERFNADHSLKKIHEIKLIDGEQVIYVASPIQKTDASCLHCHGDPANAPKELLERYGSLNAFHEHMGDIRAFISYSFNLTKSLATAQQTSIMINGILFIFLTLFFSLASRVYIIEQNRKAMEVSQRQQLDYIAHHDFLTKLTNRYGLNRDFPDILKRQNNRAESHPEFWVMMIDIDFFKAINDEFGHETGDLVLVELGKILEDSTKQIKQAKAYRLGGEEFLITLPDSKEFVVESLYVDIANSLQDIKIPNLNKTIKISAGATSTQMGETQHDILARADKALYAAKESGRAHIIVY